jgi:hypothetical protein
VTSGGTTVDVIEIVPVCAAVTLLTEAVTRHGNEPAEA